ncbi:hypothetical protein CcaverHIS002_0404720 [Cutaneotrichosporon cavernicola]|nr:hypothetical protein CcaverHIS002_0404720 [Cutaneotrichosporon cavernicola]
MPNLHANYYHGNVKAFRQELDGAASTTSGARQSSSAGRSWTLSGFVPKADPNERDALGRTVLHLAATSNTPLSYQFFQILLRNPAISVNLQDYESGYTALHRALYAGNIRAARDLLARPDIDVSVTDNEGLRAFDLFNGTVDGTNPADDGDEVIGTDLYVWGVNRNSTLGLSDASGDKTFPDRVNLLTQKQASSHPDPAERFLHVGVRDVQMAKLHTGVVTAEARGNLSLCGFGSAGRLGQKIHSQLPLLPLPDFAPTVVAIALGPDHTLALTSGGYVMTWGSNRYQQLGYVIEAPANPSPFAKDDDLIVQTTPKRIIGALKKEWVRGVAAGRMSSACWTADAVWTWGTNLGHLGYEKAANPTQINPRKVTAISQPVIDVALSDYAMICILDSNEVMCFHHDAHFKITFNSPQKSLKGPKNPAHVSMDPTIIKVTSCGQMFATLSAKGDVCTFTLPHPSEEASKDVRDRHVIVKPQILWALRKSFTAVKDMALGPDGTVIICTKSGHVFVRQRTKAGSGALKFRRIPYLQRIIKVAANETGGFAAIRVDARPSAIALKGKTLEEDLFSLQPHVRRYENQMTAEDFDRPVVRRDTEDEEDESTDSVHHDTMVATQLCHVINRWQAHSTDSLFAWSEPLLGSDVSIAVGDYVIPAHSVVLCLRAPAFARVLAGQVVEGLRLRAEDGRPVIEMDVTHPLVALLLLQYLYSDELAAVWDSRVVYTLQTKFPDMPLPVRDIKRDVRRFADILELAPLRPVLELVAKTTISTKTLPGDLATFFAQSSTPPSEVCDVVVVLADREVALNSALLRARCPFFEAMFADRDWTLQRREADDDNNVVVHMEHLRWRPMKLVFRFIHEGREDDLFDYLHQETLDEFLDFVFEVLAAATELLMDRLVLVCSRVIVKHCNPFNAAALAVEASFYRAADLKASIFDYISACMETMLESGLLDDMDDDVLRDLSKTISVKQGDKAVVPRSNILVDELMVKHREWIAVQDIPTPRVRQPYKWKPRSPHLEARRPSTSPMTTPDLKPLTSAGPVDEMFTMDEETSAGTTPRQAPSPNPSAGSARSMTPLSLGRSSGKPVWKSRTVEQEKVDLRSIMAEAAATRTPARPPGPPSTPTPARANGSASAATPRPSPSGWRPVEARPTSLAAVQASQAPQAPLIPTRATGSMAAAPVGHVIQPPRLGATPTRRQGVAWSTPTTYAPPVSSSPSQAFSLLAIQQQERDAAETVTKKVAKSFAEIQAEEAAAAAERAREDEFQRWWETQRTSDRVESGRGRGRGRGERRVPTRGGKARAAESSQPASQPQSQTQGQSSPQVPSGRKGKGRGESVEDGATQFRGRRQTQDSGSGKGPAGGADRR